MNRLEFNSRSLCRHEKNQLPKFLKQNLNNTNIPVFIDDKILFEEHAINGGGLTNYNLLTKKEGIIRYKKNNVILPFYKILSIYEKNEYELGEKPRGMVSLDKVIITRLDQLKKEELEKEGFHDLEHALWDMRLKHPEIEKESIVSFYEFDQTYFSNRIKISDKLLVDEEMSFTRNY